MSDMSCPECGEPLSPFQSPFRKTKRQWIEGGYVCVKCGCESDLAAGKMGLNMPLRFGKFVAAIVALIPLGVVAVLLLMVLLRS
jgi:hypothetical protein